MLLLLASIVSKTRPLSAFWRTVEVSSSIDDAVSSSAPVSLSP
jgi:hypothetical protein